MITKTEFLQIARDLAGSELVEYQVHRRYNKIKKQYPDATAEIARALLKAELPEPGWISVKTVAHSIKTDVNVLIKWLQQQKIVVADTICGTYVLPEVKDRVDEYLNIAIPVEPIFCKYCEDNELSYNPATYANFLQNSEGIEKTRYHPHHHYHEYWLRSQAELLQILQKWSIAYTANVPVETEGYINAFDAASYLNIRCKRLLDWCTQHPERCIVFHGQALFALHELDEIKKHWEGCRSLTEIIKQELANVPQSRKTEMASTIKQTFLVNHQDLLLSEGLLPQQGKEDMVRDVEAATKIVQASINAYPYVSYYKLQAICKLKPHDLRKKIRAGVIVAEEAEPNVFYISPNEQHSIENIRREYVLLDDLVWDLVAKTNSSFQIICNQHRGNLLSYCEENDYWGIEFTEGEELPLNGGMFSLFLNTADQETLREKLELWIKGYGLSYEEKIACLLQKYKPIYPETISKLQKYINQKPASNALLSMVDLLFSVMKKELHEMDEQSLEDDIVRAFCRNTLASSDLLSDFLVDSGITSRRFVFKRTGRTFETSAYSLADFAKIMATVVNQDVISELNLIPKAIENQRYADLWLFIALHMFAAWRVTDYIRLPVPQLPYAPELVLEKIKHGNYTQRDAESVANSMITEHQLARRTPNKTSAYSNIAPLYFFCPESCKSAFGIILSIAAAHYLLNPSPNRSFVNPVRDVTSIRAFFGGIFAEACGDCNFSGRRANKALMQAIEWEAEGDVNPLVAVNMASQLRSHKGSYGKLAETTSIYLKDAAFSGKTPEFVIHQMFERGVCSFAVDHLLSTCYGEKYEALPVTGKTKVFKELNMTPYYSDAVRSMILDAQDAAIVVVKDLLQEGADTARILENLAIGSGMGKSAEDLCLRKAANLPCNHASRQSCVGCRYEIKTKALIVRLAAALSNLNQQTNAESNEYIQSRNVFLSQKVLLSSMVEIFYHLKSQNGNYELNQYGQLIKGITQ